MSLASKIKQKLQTQQNQQIAMTSTEKSLLSSRSRSIGGRAKQKNFNQYMKRTHGKDPTLHTKKACFPSGSVDKQQRIVKKSSINFNKLMEYKGAAASQARFTGFPEGEMQTSGFTPERTLPLPRGWKPQLSEMKEDFYQYQMSTLLDQIRETNDELRPHTSASINRYMKPISMMRSPKGSKMARVQKLRQTKMMQSQGSIGRVDAIHRLKTQKSTMMFTSEVEDVYGSQTARDRYTKSPNQMKATFNELVLAHNTFLGNKPTKMSKFNVMSKKHIPQQSPTKLYYRTGMASPPSSATCHKLKQPTTPSTFRRPPSYLQSPPRPHTQGGSQKRRVIATPQSTLTPWNHGSMQKLSDIEIPKGMTERMNKDKKSSMPNFEFWNKQRVMTSGGKARYGSKSPVRQRQRVEKQEDGLGATEPGQQVRFKDEQVKGPEVDDDETDNELYADAPKHLIPMLRQFDNFDLHEQDIPDVEKFKQHFISRIQGTAVKKGKEGANMFGKENPSIIVTKEGHRIKPQFNNNIFAPDCNVRVKLANGELYEGGFKNWKRSGKGRHFYLDWTMYDGEWEADKRHGIGKLVFPDQSYFVGRFEHDQISQIDPHNRFVDQNKNTYIPVTHTGNPGKFIKGKLFGEGRIEFANKDLYEGEFKDGNRCGKGVMYYKNIPAYTIKLLRKNEKDNKLQRRIKNKSLKTRTQYIIEKKMFSDLQKIVKRVESGTYSGEWKANKRHGEGVMTWGDGSEFNGLWKSDQRVKGKMKMKDGQTYNGEWLNDKFNGRGTLKLANGNLFKGIFTKGICPNQGKIEYQKINVGGVFASFLQSKLSNNRSQSDKHSMHQKKDSYYIGEIRNFTRHGIGRMVYDNGDVYEGEWVDDERNGYGRMQFSGSDNEFIGTFINDEMEGNGRMNYHDTGEVYEGEWANHRRHGTGYLISQDKEIYYGEWNQDIPTDGQMVSAITESMQLVNPATAQQYTQKIENIAMDIDF